LHFAKNIPAPNDIASFVKNEHTNTNGGKHGMSNVFFERWTNHGKDYAKACKVLDREIVNPMKKDLCITSRAKREMKADLKYVGTVRLFRRFSELFAESGLL